MNEIQKDFNYDIIGDVHGEYETLVALLRRLGYQLVNSVFKHPDGRKVIFLGDLVDRGPGQVEVVSLVRSMCDEGSAICIMGNHEFNAIAYYTKDCEGIHLREHSQKNYEQHEAFLAAYAHDELAYRDVIEWFQTLPFWLDFETFRVVHACWDQSWVNKLLKEYDKPYLTKDLLYAATTKGTWEYIALETLMKGKEVPLPDGHFFHDKDGNRRSNIRTKWWGFGGSYRACYIGPSQALNDIPDIMIDGDHLIQYPVNEKPVFIGHYWLTGEPSPLARNIACLDYSVAHSGGALVAYRFSGEHKLHSDRFVRVPRITIH